VNSVEVVLNVGGTAGEEMVQVAVFPVHVKQVGTPEEYYGIEDVLHVKDS